MPHNQHHAQAPTGQYHTFMDFIGDENLQSNIPGVIVPQQVYTSPPSQANFSPLPSIRFFQSDRPGLRLRDALNLPIPGLHGSVSVPAFSKTGMRATLRIMWPNYSIWCPENRIDIFDHTQRANPQTLERVAQKVAKLISIFYNEMSGSPGDVSDWQLERIPFDRLYLIELRHVSRGSWQPVLSYYFD